MPLSTDFLANPRAFCQRWVIKMPGDQNGGVGLQNQAATFLPEFTAKNAGHKLHVGYNIAAAGVNACWDEYSPGHLRLVVQGTQDHQTHTGAPLTDWFRAFVLPWGVGKVARMELPDQTAVLGPNQVRAFFTAEMNGCALLVAGSPSSPLVSHLNVNSITHNTQAAKDTELDRMVTSALKLTRGGPNIGGEPGTVLHWKQPANPPGPTLGPQLARGGSIYADRGAEITGFDQGVTASVAADDRNLYHNVPPITDIRLATMGVMNANDGWWQFFYQRNICTSFATVSKLGALGPLKNTFGDWRTPRRENYYAHITGYEFIQIWPVGAGVVDIPAHGDPTQ